jgi:hypothetical protein
VSRASIRERPVGLGGIEKSDAPVHGALFARAEQPIAGIAYDDIDAAEVGERPVDYVADRCGVGDIEDLSAEQVLIVLPSGQWMR